MNHPGIFQYGEMIPLYSFKDRDYSARSSSIEDDPNGPYTGTGVVVGEEEPKWWQPEKEVEVFMGDEEFWAQIAKGDYNFKD